MRYPMPKLPTKNARRLQRVVNKLLKKPAPRRVRKGTK